MKNSRLFRILYLLMENRELTAARMAELLEVSQRTIYRDIDALSAAGIPVYATKGQGGGIHLMEQFKLDRSLLNEEEQEHILTALQSLNAVGALESSEVLTQLSGLFRKKPADWLEVEFESWGAMKEEKNYFDLLRQAILKNHLVQLRYYNSSGRQSDRTVEPIRLRFRGGSWYLFGFCRMQQDLRMFRLNRIVELKMLEETFSPRVLPEKREEWLPEETERIELELKFSKSAGYRVMDSFTPDMIRELPDGGFLVMVSFPPGSWVNSFLLSFGAELEVLRPEWIRRQLCEQAEKIRNLYHS